MTARRARRCWTLLVAGTGALACLAAFSTCVSDDAAPPVDGTAARRERPAPRSLAVARVRPAPRSRALEVPGGPSFDGAGPSILLSEWYQVSDVRLEAVEPPAAPASAMGRVKVLMLKDGQPFHGGHVCFYPADQYVEAKPWDGASWSASAYASHPLYSSFWPGFEPVLGSGDGAQQAEERTRGITAEDGTLTIDVRANVSLVPYVRYAMSGIPLVAQPRVKVPEGGETTLTIEAAPMRTVEGRCVDEGGRALAGIWVQAVAPNDERPVSRKAETSADGAFVLEVWGADADVRVRAVVPYAARPLGMYADETDIRPVPGETTVAGVVPGGRAVEVRMPAAAFVVLEVTSEVGAAPSHLQVEGLVFDAQASAWGRLGGPQYRRTLGPAEPRRVFVALPAADAVRPLLLWSWGSAIIAVDPRRVDSLAVTMPRGRSVSLSGSGWRPTDRLRVVAWVGQSGEFACIWLDGPVDQLDGVWKHDNAPTGAIEFQIVRDRTVIGRCRVPAGTDAAKASLDVE